ncbi:helix-turn-helix domain-containing protein [Nocardia brevicatena]|uniref:helix-turn-helix domain-containing protein n=1 Tax=Nocardia brevicatena TaxID=37327 RepID=UPI0034D73BEB
MRYRLGLDQQQLGDLLGVHRTTVSGWETGRTEPSFDALVRLCREGGVPPEVVQAAVQRYGLGHHRSEELYRVDLVDQPFVGPEDSDSFGEWLRGVRYRLRLEQQQFGELLGVAQGTVSNWEADIGKPHTGSMRALRDKARVPNEFVRAALEKFTGDPSVQQDPPEMQAMKWELFATVPGSEDEKDLRRRILEEYRYIDTNGRVRNLDYIVNSSSSNEHTSTWTHHEREDLRNTVHEAVLRAISRHNPAYGRLSTFAWATARGTVREAVFERASRGLSRQESREVLKVRREFERRKQSGQAVDAATLAHAMDLPVDRVEAALADIERESTLSLDASFPGEDGDGPGLDIEDTSRPKAILADQPTMDSLEEAMSARHSDPGNAMFVVQCLMRGDSIAQATMDLRAETNLTADDAQEVVAETVAILQEYYADKRPRTTDERDED